jgi:hypothetical protein
METIRTKILEKGNVFKGGMVQIVGGVFSKMTRNPD